MDKFTVESKSILLFSYVHLGLYMLYYTQLIEVKGGELFFSTTQRQYI